MSQLHEMDDDALVVLRTLHVAKDEVRWLYYSGFYDGPLSGRVAVATEQVWASRFEECQHWDDSEENENDRVCGWYRRYRLIRLTPEADAEEARRHALFREMVGDHWEIREDGSRARFDPSLKPDWHGYYDLAKEWPTWEPLGELVGWFER